MANSEKYLAYRGDLKAIAGHESLVFFVTLHPDKKPTALYSLDAEKFTLEEQPLPVGGTALAIDTDAKTGPILWIGGSEGQLYRAMPGGKKPEAIGKALSSTVTSLALLSDDRIAALSETVISILSKKDGKVLQALELPEPGTRLAADPTGQWLIAGTSKGMVFVFECEDKPEFLLSESDKLHEAAVTALLFEPEELRFFSAGADQKLLLTHARGTLEPEDRGRGNNHAEPVTGMILTPGERFITGSRDKTLKCWTRAGASKPATTKDGVGNVADLALVSIHSRPHLVAACDDNTLRFFLLDAGGKIGDLSVKVSDAYARAEQELAQSDTARRETALKELSDLNDTRSLAILAAQIGKDADHAMRKLATILVSESSHPRAVKILEDNLKHNDEAVRTSAFAGLLKLADPEEFKPLDLALEANKADIGTEAVAVLEKRAAQDDRALSRLERALDRQTRDVRRAALMSLENVHAKTSPEADLIGLKSKHADLRRLALVRLFQRKFLDLPRVQSALRRSTEDKDPAVRRTAFLVSLFTRKALAEALRARDPELHRQLYELETFTLEEEEPSKPGSERSKKTKDTKEPDLPKTTIKKLDLADADYEPLLQAMASRALETCLWGGRCLAVLGDPRAFGLLLQLSREKDVKARVEVCRALADLGDPRAVDRLRTLLNDDAGEVRDAAFTALAKLYRGQPLEAAEVGLNAAQEDVRRRGLDLLISVVRETPPESEDHPISQLLLRALNDSSAAVRSESFKACLNQKVGGSEVNSLRFILKSLHADVRREVLTEVMANIKEAWAEELLLELFSDPDPTLRKDAFEFAVKKAKPSDLEPLTEALESKYPDIRQAAVAELIKKQTKSAQAKLLPAVSDPDLNVRQAALEALVHADAEESLLQAMESGYIDVRLRSAAARARMGDPRAQKPLLDLVSEPEPQEKEKVQAWVLVVGEALKALGELGDRAAFDAVGPHLESRHASLRQAAATALVGMATPELAKALKPRLQHADAEIKYRSALALAYCGDPLGSSLVFSEPGKKVLSETAQLAAAVTLGKMGEDRIASFLDSDDEQLRLSALIALLARDWKNHDGTPARCLVGLSSKHPHVRFLAARALEQFTDTKDFGAFLVETVNDTGDDAAWTISQETISTLADVLSFAPPFLQARVVALMPLLVQDKQDAWDLAWASFEKRFAEELKSVKADAKKHKLPKLQAKASELNELAFGTYVGLVREAGSAQNIRFRQTALRRLEALAAIESGLKASAIPVLIQGLGDPNQAVRFQAFDQLRALGIPAEQLGAEALETGHTDLGVKGLGLITEGATPAAARKVLEDVMTNRTDDLALEAAKLLREHHDPVEIAALALSALFEKLRLQAVNWLSADYLPQATDKKEKARSQKARAELVGALDSRYREIRKAAAIELARKKDSAAFEALAAILKETPTPAIIGALETLGDPRTPDVLLDRAENDPAGNAPVSELIKAAGRFRDPKSAGRLLKMMDEPKLRAACHEALWTITGYDQPNVEFAELIIQSPWRGWIVRSPLESMDQIDPNWEKKQHKRHDDVLARLMEKCLELGEINLLKNAMRDARWSRGGDVDSVLPVLAVHSDDALRRSAVEAMGWRLKYRNGPADPVLKALEHRDPVTKFFAAEGLAKSGRNEGINVLLSAVDLMEDISHGQRAVLALGELGDPRALDVLLRFAKDEQHYLQGVAAESLGHLGQSDKAQEIFMLLEGLVKSNSESAESAMIGLRYFDTPAGWNLIRSNAADPSAPFRDSAVVLLAENDDPATRDLILKLLREESSLFHEARSAAGRIFGADSLEPLYAIVQNEGFEYFSEAPNIVDRLGSQGDAGRLMGIFPWITEAYQQPIAAALLKRKTLPIEEAAQAISNSQANREGEGEGETVYPGLAHFTSGFQQEKIVELAAHILGRAGSDASPHGGKIESAIKAWREKWDQLRNQPEQSPVYHPVQQLTGCLTRLVWAAGRTASAPKELMSAAMSHTADPYFRPIRLEAIRALAAGKASKQILDVLEAAALGHDPEVRAVASQALAEQDAKRAEGLAGKMLSDRVSVERLALAENLDITPALHTAAANAHYQGVALPVLIAARDLEHMKTVAHDKTLPEAARLGAIEGLARIAQETAEEELAKLGKNENEDEELRKAAWRARRRSKRLRLHTTGSNS